MSFIAMKRPAGVVKVKRVRPSHSLGCTYASEEVRSAEAFALKHTITEGKYLTRRDSPNLS